MKQLPLEEKKIIEKEEQKKFVGKLSPIPQKAPLPFPMQAPSFLADEWKKINQKVQIILQKLFSSKKQGFPKVKTISAQENEEGKNKTFCCKLFPDGCCQVSDELAPNKHYIYTNNGAGVYLWNEKTIEIQYCNYQAITGVAYKPSEDFLETGTLLKATFTISSETEVVSANSFENAGSFTKYSLSSE